MRVTHKQLRAITAAVSRAFGAAKASLQGRFTSNPSLLLTVDRPNPEHTIEGAYRYAAHVLHGPGFPVNEDHVQKLSEVTGNYLDAHRLKVINAIVTGLEGATTKSEARKVISGAMKEATNYVGMLAASETRISQEFATRDGIQRVAADIGVSDPTVAFRGRYDSDTCEYCRFMYHMPDNPMVPRVYKMSELRAGYFKAKEWDGHSVWFAPLHPHCRHVLTFCPPNMGFDERGKPKFIGLGYDVHAEQSKILKSQQVPTFGSLSKACGCHPASPVEPIA